VRPDGIDQASTFEKELMQRDANRFARLPIWVKRPYNEKRVAGLSRLVWSEGPKRPEKPSIACAMI
jgi:hypothetical protein